MGKPAELKKEFKSNNLITKRAENAFVISYKSNARLFSLFLLTHLKVFCAFVAGHADPAEADSSRKDAVCAEIKLKHAARQKRHTRHTQTDSVKLCFAVVPEPCKSNPLE